MATLSATKATNIANTLDGEAQQLSGTTDPDLIDVAASLKENAKKLHAYASRNPDRTSPGMLAAGHAQQDSSNRRGMASVLNDTYR